MVEPFLSIVGIGEDGVERLQPQANQAIRDADLVWGGARHLDLADPMIGGHRRTWCSPIGSSIDEISALRGLRRVAVLASGDPFFYGIGPRLVGGLDRTDWRCWPASSSASLAASALGWSLADITIVSLCGRPIETLRRVLAPARRLVVLSADETTPHAIVRLLRENGAGEAVLHVMERLGGDHERIRTVTASCGAPEHVARLNLVAIELPPLLPIGTCLPLTLGLDDDMFEHDGQLTRFELRACGLAALAPRPGDTLWDVGAGAGSISIEWARCHPSLRTVAFERHPVRAERLKRNAASFGVAHAIELVPGEAPDSFVSRIEVPNAIFLGGGGRSAMVDAAMRRLAAGGRIVAHAVTVETETALLDAQRRFGGRLSRIAIERLDRIGEFHAFRPSMTVTQWTAIKP